MRLTLIAAAALLAPSAGLAQQITAGQVDNFEGGTAANWTQGALGAPGVVTGGPTGTADHYIRITASGGFGAGSRLTVLNRVQWTGNYIAAGVTAIEMDLLNSGSSQLKMRIGFKSGQLQNDPGYSSTTAFDLDADGQWHHAVFPLSAGTMTAVGSPAAFDTFMTSVAEMRILHSISPDLNGDTISTVVGVDNIRAVAAPVPEPTGALAAAAVAAGLAGMFARRRRVGRVT
ncbi:MAG TPA: hypothetical protein VFG68_00870 [Fimbriiglobus sp.]|nr:hypothetical protein [Fimbriiglobus sp.]